MTKRSSELEQSLVDKGVIITDSGDKPEIERIDDKDIARVASEEAFMHQKVKVMIHATTDPNAAPYWRGGVAQDQETIFREVPTWIYRKTLEVLARKGQWLRVRDFESDEGWVHRSLTGKTPHVVVKTKVANIRSAPDLRSRIVGKAGYGEVLRTLARRADWIRIRSDSGQVGWIARRLTWGW